MKRVWPAVIFSFIGGCSLSPPVPDDFNLPIREILQHSACELRAAFVELSKPQYASFKPSKWKIAIKLTPKTNTDVNGGLGLTGKSTSISGAKYFNNWALGSVGSPGGAIDAKGSRVATITFKMTSKELMLDQKNQLICPVDSPRYHVLAEHLGIGEWLVRLVQAKYYAVGSLASFDTPTYSSQIVVKFSGNGNFTYNFPFGTNFASIAGYYNLDQTLDITMTPDDSGEKISVQTLPKGGKFTNTPPGPSDFAKSRRRRPEARHDAEPAGHYQRAQKPTTIAKGWTMNGVMLFMMLFVSPPASKADPVWTLHSTAQIQFASMKACTTYGVHLQKQLDTTDTMTMRGWCVDQGTGTSTFNVPNPFGQTPPTGTAIPEQSRSDGGFFEIPSTRARRGK